MLSLKQGQKVLDVGCGIGGGAFYMVKVWKIFRMALQIRFPCTAPSSYHFVCHGEKKVILGTKINRSCFFSERCIWQSCAKP